MARISILGSGIVGITVGRGFKELGNEVIFFDIDETKIMQLRNMGLNATTDLDHVLRSSEISFLCVPTPTKEGKIDLSFIKSATENLALRIKDKHDYHLVVVKSTVVPMTTEKVVIPILQEHSGKRIGSDIGVCVNPEFLTEIHRSWTNEASFVRDFFSEERVVIGEFDRRSGETLQALYEPLKVPIIRTDLRTAEMIKYASNCALASRISYWNEIFYICQRLGVDSNLVASVVGMDKRIGKYGTIHGKAFGGKCLPKDLEAFIGFAEELGYEPKLLKAVKEINDRIKLERGVRE
jgi:UDPglucose 6-dehydrogenase